MGEDSTSPASLNLREYSAWQVRIGLLVATVLGLVLYCASQAFDRRSLEILWAIWNNDATQAQRQSWSRSSSFFQLSIMFGLPIGAVVALPTALFFFLRTGLLAEPRIWRFALAGVLAGLAISVLGTVISTVFGFAQSRDTGNYSWIGSKTNPIAVDGIRTTYGWSLELLATVVFVAFGAFSATFARLVVGAPRGKN